jgi:hypothetical protein
MPYKTSWGRYTALYSWVTNQYLMWSYKPSINLGHICNCADTLRMDYNDISVDVGICLLVWTHMVREAPCGFADVVPSNASSTSNISSYQIHTLRKTSPRISNVFLTLIWNYSGLWYHENKKKANKMKGDTPHHMSCHYRCRQSPPWTSDC